MPCKACPCAFTDESEMIQNYGCLPSPYDLVQMKRKSGHNWACHANEKKICSGFVEHVEYMQNNNCVDDMKDIDFSVGKLITYTAWDSLGAEEAMRRLGEV